MTMVKLINKRKGSYCGIKSGAVINVQARDVDMYLRNGFVLQSSVEELAKARQAEAEKARENAELQEKVEDVENQVIEDEQTELDDDYEEQKAEKETDDVAELLEEVEEIEAENEEDQKNRLKKILDEADVKYPANIGLKKLQQKVAELEK